MTCLRRLLPQDWAIMPILAYPALLINAVNGQNGYLSAACLGGGMLLLQRRPFLAGARLGALVFKPQLLLAAPVALLAARRWTAIAGATLSATGLAAASWLVFGTATWRGFLQTSAPARATMEQGLVEPGKMASVYAAIRLLHGSSALGYAVQVALALACLALVAVLTWRRPGAPGEGAIRIAAAPLCTPFLLDYDLVCLALPMAWVLGQAQPDKWYAWEKLVLASAYVLPLFARELAVRVGVPLVPPILVTFFLVVARRVAAMERK